MKPYDNATVKPPIYFRLKFTLMRKLSLLLLITIVQLLAGFAAHAQTQVLFDYGSTWRYLDNGTNQGTTWKDVGFNDGAWTQATGIFGYSDPWITVYLNACGTVAASPTCSNKYITTYFRKNVTIDDINKYSGVTLNAWRDDGIVVYVNGTEVWRSNMPTGTILYNTQASSAIGSPNENTPVSQTIPISAFVNGNNVIAVELHQESGTSSDLTFNMQALGVIKSTLFAFGSSWKYNAGSDLGTAWRAPAYDESTWPTGTGHIGYGETWTNTCVPAGPTGCTAGCMPGSCTKYPTTYFRKTLNIPDPSLYDSVRFSVYRDDGIVMYVNGTEVWRNNMPTGTINYNTMAPNNVNGTTGTYAESLAVVQSIPISAFSAGDNVIAIELHQNSATSSDLDFNVQATGVVHVIPGLVRGPYLQMGNESAFTVRWRTNVACKSKVEVGTVYGTYPITVNDANPVTDHEVRVTGLSANTKYYYRFGTDVEVLQGDTSNFCVTAPTTPRRVTIAAYGDCGQNANGNQSGSLTAYRNYLASIGLKAADMMILIGDNAYNSGTDAEYQTGFFNAYQGNILKNHMLFPAPGNHDYNNGSVFDLSVPYYSIFTTPTNGESGGVPSGTEAYYSYNWGDVHFLSLDSYGKGNAGTTRMYDTLGAQVQWIKADLAANTKKWVIAYWHHPPYTMGSHNSDNENELKLIRQNFIKILERNGVDLIICGHSHDYERSQLMKGHYGLENTFNAATHVLDNSSGKYDGSANSCPYATESGKTEHGTVYVVSGSSGASDGGSTQAGYPHNAMPYSISDGGMFFLDINNNRLDAKFIRKNGTIWDQFTIMKDVKVQDTVQLLHGTNTELSASWEGNYNWAPGVTTRNITVAPTADTLVEVKDNATNTCLVDKHYIDMLCTMPDITSWPSDIVREGCDAMVTYAITDTGRPTGSITYTFAGATAGMGNGTGSGSTFSIGVTTVTITSTNECGSASRSFTITIKPLPTAYNMTGGGGYCPGAAGVAVGLANSQNNVSYQLYNGTTSVGTTIAGTGAPLNFGILTSGTYSVLATDITTNCTNAMANNATVFVQALPTAYNVAGGGNYCTGDAGRAILLENSDLNVSYQLYNGGTTIGSPVNGNGSAISFGVYTTAASYSVVATDIVTSCTNNMSGSVAIAIDPLPTVHMVTGGGNYCAGGIGVPVGLDNTDAGVTYQLYNGTTAVSGQEVGIGTAISFGNYTTAGTYTVLATDVTAGCTKSMTGNAIVLIDPLPVSYNINAGGNYCSGGSGVAVTLSGSQTGVSYQLYYGAATSGAAIMGTGAPISFGSKTGAGGYTVTALNTTTGCQNTMTGTTTIGINGLPTMYAITGGGNICAGAPGVNIGLGGSMVGVNYRLYMGSTAVGTTIAGNGTPISFGNFATAGNYYAVATDATTNCSNSMTGIATVNVTPLATPAANISVFPNDTVCAGTSVTYNVTPVNGGVSPGYEWKVNGITMGTGSSFNYTPANADVVSVILYSSLPCLTSPMVTADRVMSVRPNVMPVATVTANTGDSVCEGTPVTFTVTSVNGGSDPAYRWLKNSVTVGTGADFTYNPSDGDGVLVSMTSNAPCRLTESVFSNLIAMKVDESNIPVVNISTVPGQYISNGQSVTFTATVWDAGAAPTYKWLQNGVAIPGATNATYVTSKIDNQDTITCSVKASGLCGLTGFNSLVMKVVPTGVFEVGTKSQLQIVPNPTNGSFMIEGMLHNNINELANITITNVLGQEVYRSQVKISSGKISERVSLKSTLPNGAYLLILETGLGKQIYQITLSR